MATMRHCTLVLLLVCAGLAVGAIDSAAEPRLWGTTGFGTTTSTLIEIDGATGEVLATIGPVGYVVNGMVFDPTTAKLFASTAVQDPRYNGLIEIDPATGAGTPVGVHRWGLGGTTAVTNLTVDSTGQMYGWWDPGEDDLVWIDKTTGIATRVGESFVGTAQNGLAFDSSDTLYMINSGGGVYRVDPITGAAVLLRSIGRTAHHGVFDPTTDLYYGVSGSRGIVVANVYTGTIVSELPNIPNLHTLALGDKDSDEDGLRDSCETRFGTDPFDPNDPASVFDDVDGDLLNWLEECTHGTDPWNPDTDGDQVDDGTEVMLGTNPVVKDPATIVEAGPGVDIGSIYFRFQVNVLDPTTTGYRVFYGAQPGQEPSDYPAFYDIRMDDRQGLIYRSWGLQGVPIVYFRVAPIREVNPVFVGPLSNEVFLYFKGFEPSSDGGPNDSGQPTQPGDGSGVLDDSDDSDDMWGFCFVQALGAGQAGLVGVLGALGGLAGALGAACAWRRSKRKP